jgi:transcription-repair coupling factor (superfamily II helicase)
LKVSIQIPDDYIPQINLRLDLYKRVSSIEGLDELERIKEEAQDRNGPLPASVKNLFLYGAAKFLARRVKIKRIDRISKKIVFQFLPDSTAYLGGLPCLLERYSGSITPQGVMSLYLSSKGETEVLNETILILKELSLM